MRKNTFHKQTSFTYHQVIASARSAVLKYRTIGCNLISTCMKRRWNLQCKSSMQKYQIARPESCFIGQNLLIIQFCLQIYFFFGQLNQSQKYIVYDISVSRGYCQFRSAQQQNTIWTLVSKELQKLLLKFLGLKLKIISPNQVFTPLKKKIKKKSDILLIKNKTTAFFN